MKRLLLFAFACMLASACSTYQETGLVSALDDQVVGVLGIKRSGVHATPLARDTYRIHAFGNQNASHEKTNAVALVKAATLAAENGYDYFSIVDYDQWVSKATFTVPTTVNTLSSTTGSFSVSGSSYASGGFSSGNARGRVNAETVSSTTVSGGYTYVIEKPKTDIVVTFIANASPAAASALRVSDIIHQYGKLASYKPKLKNNLPNEPVQEISYLDETSEISPNQSTDSRSLPATSPPKSFLIKHDPPTIEQVYLSLSAAERAHVHRLSPAARIEYLENVRRTRF